MSTYFLGLPLIYSLRGEQWPLNRNSWHNYRDA